MEIRNLDGFLDIMAKETGVLENLLQIGKDKQEVLLKGDLEKLAEIVRQEEQLIIAAGQLEHLRYESFASLAGQFNLPETATLKELAEVCPAEVKRSINEAGTGLSGLIRNLQELNTQNISLIDQSLGLIQYTVESLAGNRELPLYNKQEKEQRPAVSLLVDQRV